MKAFETQALHPPGWPDNENGGLSTPIHMAASFKLPGFGIKLFDALLMQSDQVDHVYSRWSNPTLRVLEARLAHLEGAEAGVVFASGMAAISALLLTLLSEGDHLVASDVCYSGALELMGQHLPRFGIEVSLVDTSDPRQVQAALRPNTRLVYIETPANPILRLADIQAVCQVAHSVGVPLAVDSTFASPVITQPIKLGADYVIHSLTKYFNDHNDALGGVILGPRAGIQRIRKDMLVHLGGALSPFNAWLILRGIETLAVRVAQVSQNAMRVARYLASHPLVAEVLYPGLESHPQYKLAHSQMRLFGGMIAFRLKGGLRSVINLTENIKVFTFATSLGHPNSLIFYYPTDMYVDAVPYLNETQKKNIRTWTGDGILRASIGLENPDDLIADLEQALQHKTFKGWVGPAAYQILKKIT